MGQCFLYSINYDRRLWPNISIRVGFSNWSIPFFLFAEGNLSFTGFPVTVNYLTGEGTAHLEVGIGIIPATVSFQGRDVFFGSEVDGRANTVLGTATLGYRSQARDGGFVFRIGLTPLFTFKEAQLWGGLSLGFGS
jgi:hypothetical protein